MENAARNQACARACIRALFEAGVREFVLCPGGRNAPLVVALDQAELGEPQLHVWQHFEERSAAFFALGRARALRAPTAVVVTSGTAVVETYAAVMEAHYQGVGLVVVSADRPATYRGSGAPQAIDQVRMFGAHADYIELPFRHRVQDIHETVSTSGAPLGEIDAQHSDSALTQLASQLRDSLASWRCQGPLQLNVEFDEPLLAQPPTKPIPSGAPQPASLGVEPTDADAGKPARWWRTPSSLVTSIRPGHQQDPEAAISLSDPLETQEQKIRQVDLEREALEIMRHWRRPLILVGELLEHERADVGAWLAGQGAHCVLESTSGLREEPLLADLRICCPDISLSKDPRADGYDGLLRIGGVPTARLWRDLSLHDDAIAVVSLSRTQFAGLPTGSRTRGVLLTGDIASMLELSIAPRLAELSMTSRWETSDAVTSRDMLANRALLELLDEMPRCEASLIRALSREVVDGSPIYVGNSGPIRDWDLAAAPPAPAHVLANRGVNGIDGQLSTALGIFASRRPDAAPAWILVGDLTALYDLAGPWILPQLSTCALRIVVACNGGGRIFERMFASPRFINAHSWQLEHAARLWGLDLVRSADGTVGPLPPRCVVALDPDPEQSRDFWTVWSRQRMKLGAR